MASKALCLFLLALASADGKRYPGFVFKKPSAEQPRVYLAGDVGEKLVLTSYIEAGQLELARNLSKVTGGPFPEDIPSYSGFFTVNKTYDNNLFFWFFPAEEDYENAPVLLWLQGGPGASSLFGLFTEVGPFFVAEDGVSVIRNPYSWHKNHSIIFIDNPVGAGFSYTKEDAGYVTNQDEVGEQLHTALVQFFTVFPELQKNHFFIAGESYAGKYVTALGHTIHVRNPGASLQINLKGVAIGDGVVDPASMVQYSDQVYQWGLVDIATRETLRQYQDSVAQYIAAGEDQLAIQLLETDVDGTIMKKLNVSTYNLMTNSTGIDFAYAKLLDNADVRSALHVGNQTYSPLNMKVNGLFEGEYLRSTLPWVEELLDAGYRVVFYNGQLDIIVGYQMTVRMIKKMQFNAAEEYKTASRKIWRVNGRVAGYTKTAGNMTEVMVRNAGHNVPTDQPAVSFQLIYSITRNSLP